jgi:hypothetical protein
MSNSANRYTNRKPPFADGLLGPGLPPINEAMVVVTVTVAATAVDPFSAIELGDTAHVD